MSTWLHCPSPRDAARVRLVCFPHAGGAASFFRSWGAGLPDDVEVHAVRYPGRAERIDEPPATDLRALADDIAADVAAVDGPPVALFGHSLGAVVALEAARSLAARDVELVHLFASGSREGPLPGPDELGGTGPADDTADMLRMLELGGTPPELAADPDFQELVLPYVRADSSMFHAYTHRVEPALPCPVTTVVGDADPDADRRPWSGLTSRFREHVVAGNHFYLVDAPPLSLVAGTLRAGAVL